MSATSASTIVQFSERLKKLIPVGFKFHGDLQCMYDTADRLAPRFLLVAIHVRLLGPKRL